jgi:hypothetical protein
MRIFPGSFFYFFWDLLLFQLKSTIYTHDLVDFNKALSLFNDMQYASAQIILKIKLETNDEELKSDCAYYDANCASCWIELLMSW